MDADSPAVDPAASRGASVAGSVGRIDHAGPAAPAGPVPVSDRIVALDVLRGLALLGIVMVNVFTFALPFMEGLAPPKDPAPASEEAGFAIMRAFFQLKWMPIFSMLFGAGLAVQMARAAARGDGFVPRYLRRIGVLLLIGLAHALLLWFGDILVWYAVLGAFLLLVRHLAAPKLIQAGAVLVVVGGVLAGGCFSAGVLAEATVERPAASVAPDAEAVAPTGPAGAGDEAPDASDDGGPADPPRGFEAIVAANVDPNDPRWVEAEIAAYGEGPWADAFAFRLVSWAFALLLLPFGWAFVVFGCFMIGAGLLRSGFFDPSRSREQARVARLALLVGVPLELASAAGSIADPVGVRIAAELVHGVSGPVMAVGLLAGITWLVSTGRTAAWDGPVRAAGRAALSVYLGQTVLGTALFHWWGLGLFADVPRLQLLVIALVIWAVLAGLATAWLGVFRFGPAEWLWRSLTYGRLQPFLRSRAHPRTPGAAAIDAPVDADTPHGDADPASGASPGRAGDGSGTERSSGDDAARP